MWNNRRKDKERINEPKIEALCSLEVSTWMCFMIWAMFRPTGERLIITKQTNKRSGGNISLITNIKILTLISLLPYALSKVFFKPII